MDTGAIQSVISNSRMGTRIPEELLGFPSRTARYDRTYSMDAIDPVSPTSRRAVQASEEKEEAEKRSTIGALTEAVLASQNTGALALTYGGKTFAEMLAEMMDKENPRDTQLVSDALDLYRIQQTMRSFSGDTTAANLTTLGISGLSVLGLSLPRNKAI